MTEALKQIDSIQSDLKEVEKWEKFYKENNPQEFDKMPPNSSGVLFIGVSTQSLSIKLNWLKQSTYPMLDTLIKQQQKLINKLKKK